MNKVKQQTHRIPIYFPLDLLERLRRIASQHRRSVNSEVLWILQQYLECQEKEKEG